MALLDHVSSDLARYGAQRHGSSKHWCKVPKNARVAIGSARPPRRGGAVALIGSCQGRAVSDLTPEEAMTLVDGV